MNLKGISSVFFNLQKSTLNAICGVPEHLVILVCLRCLILTLFVVAGGTFEALWEVNAFHRCLILTLFAALGRTWPSMLDFDAICRGRRYFWKSLLAFDA